MNGGGMNDSGEAVTGMVVGVATVGVTGVMLAVSESAANNATFTVALLTIIGALLTTATWVNKRWNRALEERIRHALDVRTRPIQPDANGGKSLSDLHKKIDARSQVDDLWRLGVQEQLRDFDRRLDRIEGSSTTEGSTHD
jgi:hypothetical protein